MRIYIIGNDGIALSREAPAALNEGEIMVASNEELHAAVLSGKQLLALWNARHGPETAPAARRYWNRGRQRYCRSLVQYCSTLRVSADRAANRAAHTRGKTAAF
jgi:hypothetical protein